MSNSPIKRSEGLSKTERLLFELCDRTFLKLWTYPNPYKSDGHEMCDLITVFDNQVFVFFDRYNTALETYVDGDFLVAWKRWKKATIDKQLKTVSGAERYLRNPENKLFLDAKCTQAFPINIPRDDLVIHKIIVAHGAAQACKDFSEDNVRGSLAVSYADAPETAQPRPFQIALSNKDIVHVFDSDNLELVLAEFDTLPDLLAYFKAKEDAIKRTRVLWYAGEEDVIVTYFRNFDEKENAHYIKPRNSDHDVLMIAEGMWGNFENSAPYQRRQKADESSYFWDELIQSTSINALAGTVGGHPDIFNRPSAIKEMAKEPRFSRRALSDAMIGSLRKFPNAPDEFYRSVGFYPSIEEGKFYLFMIVHFPGISHEDGRGRKINLLEIACGVAKLKFTHVKKIIGLAIEAPHLNKVTSEDYLFMEDVEISEDDKNYYAEMNKDWRFFQTDKLKMFNKTTKQFPD